MVTNARTLLCAVPQPVGNAPKRYSLKNRLSLRLFLTAGLIAGFQGLTAGPAAVATLPSALTARPFAVAAMDPTVGYKPALKQDAGLFRSIIENAFSRQQPREKRPAPESYPEETHL